MQDDTTDILKKKCKRCGGSLAHMPVWADYCKKCLEEMARKNH